MDPLMEAMLERALQPTPIRDSVERTAVPQERKPVPMNLPAPGADVSALSPTTASVLGGLADTASTYAFLKRGTAQEDNPLVAGMAAQPGKMAAMGVATNLALPFLLKKTLGKKWPRVFDALAANQGALQMGYGALNTQNTLSPRTSPNTAGDIGNRKTSDIYAAMMSQDAARVKR